MRRLIPLALLICITAAAAPAEAVTENVPQSTPEPGM